MLGEICLCCGCVWWWRKCSVCSVTASGFLILSLSFSLSLSPELQRRPPHTPGPRPVGQIQRTGHQVHYQNRGIREESAWLHRADHCWPNHAPQGGLFGHSGRFRLLRACGARAREAGRGRVRVNVCICVPLMSLKRKTSHGNSTSGWVSAEQHAELFLTCASGVVPQPFSPQTPLSRRQLALIKVLHLSLKWRFL